MEAIIDALAKAIEAVYQDPSPQNGTPTNILFRDKAIKMIGKYPEKVIPTLQAYDKLVKDVNSL